MYTQILEQISQLDTPGYFITAVCTHQGEILPSGLEAFILEKLSQINSGLKTRKFVFRQDKWRLIITFFPTTKVVDERYALKNHVYKQR